METAKLVDRRRVVRRLWRSPVRITTELPRDARPNVTTVVRRVVSSPVRQRRLLVAFGSSLGTTALAIAINLATEWKRNWYAWVAVGALTVFTFIVSLTLTSNKGKAAPASSKTAVIRRHGFPKRSDEWMLTKGVVLEVIDTSPDGTHHQIRAYTEEAARRVVELRKIELTPESEDHGR